MTPHRLIGTLWLLLVAGVLALAQPPAGAPARTHTYEFAVVLEDPPLAEVVQSREEFGSPAARRHLARVSAAQQSLETELAKRHVPVTAKSQTLVNAVFVRATLDQADELRTLRGVRRVELQLPLRRHLNRALDLVRVPQAWNQVGGEENAGRGIKIGIIDSGIDNTHPAFQDSSLQAPAGYPRGRPEDLPYTNSKIIVARSYVAQLPFAEVDPVDSRPDDTTPRDRVGHGTAAAMIAAGRRVTGPSATIAGVAPKAYLGNYKVFGSPGVNDSTRTPVLVQALTDAISDGMDIVTMSIGSPALYGPLDNTCKDSLGANQPCDVRAQALENAIATGKLTIVVSAGNDGDLGIPVFPSLNTIHTPGTAPSAITVGASTNSHEWFAGVLVGGSGVPQRLQRVPALFGNGPRPEPSMTAPAVDVRQLQDNGLGCAPLGNGTLTGKIAIIQRGTCGFFDKVTNALKAGAAGVVLFQTDGVDAIFAPQSLAETAIPAVLIGNTDGVALRDYIRANPSRPVTLDTRLEERSATADIVADFSSRGPAIGDVSKGEAGFKPDLVAVGTDLYVATQNYDPNGEMYDPSRFARADGTSFSAPMVAGALAIIKQQNPSFGPKELKSAAVTTATTDVSDGTGRAYTIDVGGGKLHAGLAPQAALTVDPPALSFGALANTGALALPLTLRLTNNTRIATTYSLSVDQRTSDSRASVVLSSSTVQLNPGVTAQITVRLQGNSPSPGFYEGAIAISGGSQTYRVPYLYIGVDGAADNVFPLAGDNFLGAVGEKGWLMALKVVDRYGAPVRGAKVQFKVMSGGGRIDFADETTDVYGIAAASVTLGGTLGEQQLRAEINSAALVQDFFGRARLIPTISSNGVVNAASFDIGQGLAPGSYITIYGRGLADTLRAFSTPYLPVSLAGVSVSFDAPQGPPSLPGRIHFVSEGQINVQIPWEFLGFNNASMKVSLGPGPGDASDVYTVPLAPASPGFIEYDDAGSGRRLIAALDTNYRLLTGANPARRGQAAQLYANGLGDVTNRPPSGEPSPVSPLATVKADVQVTVGGRPAQVLFKGLAPGFVALYQVNIVVPNDAPTGIADVIMSVGGISSKVARLAVE